MSTNRSNVILYDGPCAKNSIECEVECGDEEFKVRHDEPFSKVDDEQLDEDLDSSCNLKQVMGDISKD